jgi:osmotically-inducible protein OsmY
MPIAEFRGDEEIKKNVVEQLYWDNKVDASNIKVTVREGRVTLSGTVQNYPARSSARLDAFMVRGVNSVADNINVCYRVNAPDDESIETIAKSVIQWNPDLKEDNIDATVDNGKVFLTGTVDTMWKKIKAENIVSNVDGVLSIINKIAVIPTGDIIDENIAKDIIAAIERNVSLDVEDVNVKVEDGLVTLTGTVPSSIAHRAANEAAIYTYGVVGVDDNNLLIAPS